MNRSDVLTLIGVKYKEDAIGQQVPVEVPRTVFCNISSVSGAEFFEAGRAGLSSEYRVNMFGPDYQGEEIAEINGERYSIYRRYKGKKDDIDLYLERKAGTV